MRSILIIFVGVIFSNPCNHYVDILTCTFTFTFRVMRKNKINYLNEHAFTHLQKLDEL